MNYLFNESTSDPASSKLLRVLDILPTAAAVIQGTTIRYVNDEFGRLLGLPKSQLTNGDIGLIQLDEKQLKHLKAFDNESETVFIEKTVQVANGYSKSVHFNFMPLKVSEMNGGYVLTAIDITDSLNARSKIEAHERRLESFAKIVEFDSDDLKTALDYSLAEALSLTESKIGYFYYYNELTQKFKLNTWSKEVMPECSVENKQTEYDLEATGCWGEAVRQRKPFVLNDYSMENPYVKGIPKGHVKLKRFMTVPIFDKEQIVAVVGVANKEEPYDDVDIKQLTFLMTFAWKVLERLRYEQALFNSEKELQIIFDRSPNIMMVLDNDFCITKINKRGIEHAKIEENAIIGSTPGTVFGCKAMGNCNGECNQIEGDVDCIIRSAVDETLNTNNVVIREEDTLLTNHNGIDKVMDVLVSTAAVMEKEMTHVLLAVDDITKQKTLQQQLNQSQKLQAIGQLAGGIAHDFNNILAGIIGYAELMEQELRKYDNPSKLSKYNKHIIDGSNRAKDLIKQILTFSRKNHEAFDLIVLNPIIKEALDLLKVTLPSSVSITTQLAKEPLAIRGNTTMIHELLINMINNSSHAMDGKGTIKIRLYKETLLSPLQGIVEALPEGAYVVLEIEDDGEGIDPIIAEHIFEPFFTTKLGKGGTGMGLSVVYGIVQSHEGTIILEPVEPHGALFRLYFKLEASEDLVMNDEVHEKCLHKGNGEKILLVDDEEIILSMLTEFLQEQGYEVYSFSSSESAVHFLKDRKVDLNLIITDQTMPLISGIELASIANKYYKGIPVILCSGDSDLAKEAAKGIMNIEKYLSKPIRLNEISDVIAELI